LKAVSVVSALGHQHIGILKVFHHHRRHAKLSDRLNQSAARDADWINVLLIGTWILSGHIRFIADLAHRAVALSMQLVLGRCLPPIALEGGSLHAAAAPQGLRYSGHVWSGRLDDVDLSVFIPVAFFRQHGITAQDRVHGAGNIAMDCNALTVNYFDHDCEGRRRTAFQHGFLGAASPGFIIRKRHRFNATHQV